ncbi:hypothetical protein SGLAM104S_09353 [Streptomyces glaucescens]
MTVMPKNDTSSSDRVWSPVSRFTEPGPISVVAAPSALRSTTTLSGGVLPAAEFGPVKSALIWTVPSGSTVWVAFHTSGAFFPPASGTGHAVSGTPPEVTSPTGILVQPSASERRQEKDTLSYLPASASATSGSRRAVRSPSDGWRKPPEPAWNVYCSASDLLSALSTERTWRVWVPFLGGVTLMFCGVLAPPVVTFVHVTPSSDHSSQLWSAAGGVTVKTPGWPSPLTHWPAG